MLKHDNTGGDVYWHHLCKAQHCWLVLSDPSHQNLVVKMVCVAGCLKYQIFKHHCHLIHVGANLQTFYWLPIPHCPSDNNLLQIKQFSLLPAMAILCSRDHTTEDYGVWKTSDFSLDTDHFDKLARQAQNIKSAIKNMSSRPWKGKEPENDGEGQEGD